jgi:hypothetical protein
VGAKRDLEIQRDTEFALLGRCTVTPPGMTGLIGETR